VRAVPKLKFRYLKAIYQTERDKKENACNAILKIKNRFIFKVKLAGFFLVFKIFFNYFVNVQSATIKFGIILAQFLLSDWIKNKTIF
jgi:hypothetical protein